MSKLIGADQAAALVKERDTLAVMGSGGGVVEPTLLLRKLGARYLREGRPRNLTIYHANGIGDKQEIGTDLLAHEGLVKRVIGGHWGMAPAMGRLAAENKIEAYNFPQGVLSQMYGAIAANKPGVITKIGLNTYIDPRIEGGKLNPLTQEQLVEVIELGGEEWLYYPKIKLDVCFIRGTTADTKGNITMEQETAFLDGLSIAQATRNCGGIVIAQVKYLAERGTLDARLIKVPGIYVDYIVVDQAQKQTCEQEYLPSLCGGIKVPLETIAPLSMDYRKMIARRASLELYAEAVVNLGVGLPSGVASVAAEEGVIDDITFTVEQGIVGGVPAGGIIFGVAHNPEAIIGQIDQFNFYDGGGLDIAFLGAAQIDSQGNVNSSKTGTLLAGCGGFINISQSAKRIVFCSAFTAKGLEMDVVDGELKIVKEGQINKFVRQVDQITFSGKNAKSIGQSVVFVTERAVFMLSEEGIVLKEVAPGIDIERDIVAHMEFAPIIREDPVLMDLRIFKPERMGVGHLAAAYQRNHDR
jgi:propionate CoA-transferase